MTALDDLSADIDEVVRLVRTDPYGPTAKILRDDLRRAHRVGVERNRVAVRKVIQLLPREMMRGMLSPKCPCAGIYKDMLR